MSGWAIMMRDIDGCRGLGRTVWQIRARYVPEVNGVVAAS